MLLKRSWSTFPKRPSIRRQQGVRVLHTKKIPLLDASEGKAALSFRHLGRHHGTQKCRGKALPAKLTMSSWETRVREKRTAELSAEQ